MNILNRRSMLLGAASAAFALPLGTLPVRELAACITKPCGCCGLRFGAIAGGPNNTTSVRVAKSSGDAETDRFLGAALGRLANTFKVSPGFAFFDDGEHPNAFAAPETLLDNGPGTVLMGMHLFGQLMARVRDGGIAVIAVCAHEFGHIHQMQGGYQGEFKALDKTARPIELHADFLAGYYLSLRKTEHPELDLNAVGGVLYKMGDWDVTSPRHHGSPDERVAALSAGFKFGSEGTHDVAEAAKAGLSFVRRI
jgi:hypothetical protein